MITRKTHKILLFFPPFINISFVRQLHYGEVKLLHTILTLTSSHEELHNSLAAINRSSSRLTPSLSHTHTHKDTHTHTHTRKKFTLIHLHCSVDVSSTVKVPRGVLSIGLVCTLQMLLLRLKQRKLFSMKRTNNRVSLFRLGELRALTWKKIETGGE